MVTPLLNQDNIERKHLVSAVVSLPNEYKTQLCSCRVRCPYTASSCIGMLEWLPPSSHLLTDAEYQQNASVFDPCTLDVLVSTERDGPIFILTGRSSVLGDVSLLGEATMGWAIVDDVQEMGSVVERIG